MTPQSPVEAGPFADRAAAVSAYLDSLIAAGHTPGLQYVATTREGPLFTYAGGFADLRTRAPMRPDTSLMAYSMSKTITAIAVLQLVDAGRIALDDPIGQWVETPYGEGVTVRRLLAHTAGVPNPMPLGWVHLAPAHDEFDESAALRAVLARHHRLASTPGARFRYSNLGYWLLGPLVERASGVPFTTYVSQLVLAPLGIDPAALGYRIIDARRHASGYLEKWSVLNLIKRLVIDPRYIDRYDGRWLRLHTHYLNGPAFGGLVGSAPAFAMLLADQLRDVSAVLAPTARTALYEIQKTTAGAEVPMTLGWHVKRISGDLCYFKEGGGGGFHSMMRLYPSRGLGSVLIANATQFTLTRVLDRVDQAWST